MVSLTSLWLPVLVSAVAVFIASSVIHTVLPFHRDDYKTIPGEDEVLEALRRFNIPPGEYIAPRPTSAAEMRSAAFIEKTRKGPIVIMTTAAGGSVSIAKNLGQWFLYLVVVSVLAADLAGGALPRGAGVEDVCWYAGTIAFMGYSLALVQNSIWGRRSWWTTFKALIDGVIYSTITGQVFGWMWPR
jgi:hypothetical protein